MSEPIPVALALGSNLGDRLAALRAAVESLEPFVQVTAISKIYETPAAYVTDQPAFLNAAVIGTTRLDPLALLWNLKDNEVEIGRLPTFHYGPRLIDIDLLFHGDAVMHTTELTLPHPHMSERDFVLKPLADIAPLWRHPQSGKTVVEMLALLSETPLSYLEERL